MSKNEEPPSYEVATNKEYNNPIPTSQHYNESQSAAYLPTVSPQVLVAYSLSQYGPEPQRTICPHCHASIKTTVKSEPTTSTHISALLLCCLCWPCVCLPYFLDSCQNRNHYCPNCNSFLGTYGAHSE